jgi:hypothetical protein
MRTCVLAPAANVNDVAEVMANAEVSLEAMLLIVIDEPVVFLASTLSVLLADTTTSPYDRNEGASAKPTVRWLTSALLKTTGFVPPTGFTVWAPLGQRPSESVVEVTTAPVASERRSTRRTPVDKRFAGPYRTPRGHPPRCWRRTRCRDSQSSCPSRRAR